jgi:hypothetical protein
MTGAIDTPYRRSTGLVDVLDRVLDKGLVVAGDIRVSLAEVELLTIRIRLLVCSIDKAEQIGLDWWRQDPALSVGARRLATENETLKEQVRMLEARVAALAAPGAAAAVAAGAGTAEPAAAREDRQARPGRSQTGLPPRSPRPGAPPRPPQSSRPPKAPPSKGRPKSGR